MIWLRSLGVSILSAIAGCAGAVLMASVFVGWYRISSFEGGSGYYVALFGLLGIVFGVIAGVVSTLVIASRVNPGFAKSLGVSLAVIAATLLVVTALGWLGAEFPPTIDGHDLVVEVEAKLPADVDLPEEDPGYGWHVTITADRGSRRQTLGPLRLSEAKRVDGRWIVPATVALQTVDPGKALGVNIGNGHDQYFRMSLPGRPTRADFEWSSWLTEATDGNLEPVPAEESIAIRYRVQLFVEQPTEPAGPSQEELEAKAENEKSVAFAALTPDDPISDWLKYTHFAEPQERREAAAAAIAMRPNVVEELSAEILSADRRQSDLAMRSVALMENPPAGLAPAVIEVGHGIADDVRTVNATSVESDPGYERAAATAVRFAGWTEAARSLHGRGGADMLPVMHEILELAKVRTDSQVMQGDIVRVAGYYVETWGAGNR